MSKNSKSIFDFTEPQKQVSWAVEDIIQEGSLFAFVADSGTGKSFVVEQLCISCIFGMPFMGKKVMPGDVLLIDEETPTSVLTYRLKRFYEYYHSQGHKPKGNLHFYSMRGYDLSNVEELRRLIKSLKVRLIVIDSLRYICKGIDENKGLKVLLDFKTECLNGNTTVVLNHHISDHRAVSVDDLMTSNAPGNFLMGDSAVPQNLDGYILIGNHDKGDKLEMLYFRPVSKRYLINMDRFTASLVYNGEGINFAEANTDKTNFLLSRNDRLLWPLFFEDNKQLSVKDIRKELSEALSDYQIRQSLQSLESKGFITRGNTQHNRYVYSAVTEEDKGE